ncbi:MAG: hypothetical protein K2H53_05785, partial [Clostridia bacterium]|nr:hypothetical protein [Clostridia bacterium]
FQKEAVFCLMDLKFEVTDYKYSNIKDVLRSEFKISSRLYLKLRNSDKIYLNREIKSILFRALFRRCYRGRFKF